MLDTVLWGFMYLVLDYSTGVPEGIARLEASGAYVFVTEASCERQREANSEVTREDGTLFMVVSPHCFATTFHRSGETPGSGSPPPALTVNRDCAYKAAQRLVDPALPNAGLTGAALKARQRVRIATRKEVVADIHAGTMGDQATWDVLCPPAPPQ